ncbi:DNA replication/repair protein RecF [Cellulomonas sp. zg-ZUI222]|uniref:DNA replication and repair protein RecF n=1 Tax=Cellulomonas wangleii TaxID=2816956 RepID=A0ABX8D4K6_9CELL|nr:MULTISPECIES: DNA replication/repair protein RecF [Cellulomonas]MBO0898602.1 DNA replication/repair protein RecF [Cellulomonas sp. zg-ZUI22]MBO0919464.1 DNA replication/repair protein RecF [Cellulomonas wangleii]MBO0924396.1 DNA replication/repair protein RecF [Cellulomonas wangleii]QVI62394.1 DNA replication/repair protein RecF [Cellulomonas wangleii]
MYVAHLSLTDFRSYPQVELPLDPGITALVGPNGQGKTNLVEAIGYVATLGSHRVPSDAALVRAGTNRAVVRAKVVREERATLVEVEITPGKANRARVNGGSPGRARDVLGILRTVLFAPEDLALVKGDPDGRRRFLDDLLVQLTPRIAGVLSDYERVLRQRSALLKSAAAATRARSGADLRTLDVWDAKLAQTGAQVVVARQALVAALRPRAAESYHQVSAGQGELGLTYRSSLDAALGQADDEPAVAPGAGVEVVEARLLEAMGRLRSKEIERGVCLVGPHRDDLHLTLGDLPAKGYASHGESWSVALALRLASYALLTHGVDDAGAWAADWGPDGEPVLILDDVFAELDTRRRERLAELVAPARQVLVTAAVPQDVPEPLAGARVDVMAGEVARAR